VEGLLVKIDGPKQALAGQPSKLTAVLNNPWTHAIKVDLGWTDDTGKAMAASVQVDPKSTAQQPIVTKAPGPHQMVSNMDLTYSVADLKLAGKIRFSVPVGQNIESTAPDNRNPDWTLDKRSDYLSFTEADPTLTAYNWRGPDDLSAKVWVWLQKDAIQVRVDVRDDIHVQKEMAQDCWKGDSLEVAFQSVNDTRVNWEIGVAQADDDTLLRAVWASPTGVLSPESQFTATCKSIPGGLRYEVTLPCGSLGLTDAALRDGLRFNLAVNDNDGTLRKGLMRIGPGIGEPKTNPLAFPVLYFPTKSGTPHN
jgi:hypothetical protein